MSLNWQDIASAAVTLFFIMDPLGSIPPVTQMLLNGIRDIVNSL